MLPRVSVLRFPRLMQTPAGPLRMGELLRCNASAPRTSREKVRPGVGFVPDVRMLEVREMTGNTREHLVPEVYDLDRFRYQSLCCTVQHRTVHVR